MTQLVVDDVSGVFGTDDNVADATTAVDAADVIAAAVDATDIVAVESIAAVVTAVDATADAGVSADCKMLLLCMFF